MSIRFAAFCFMLVAGLAMSGPSTAREKLWTELGSRQIQPEAGKALVIFLRPSSYGGAVRSTLYELRDGDTHFIGVLPKKTRTTWQADPGQTRFMIVGENADFMEATLEAGKTYYVLGKVRPGVWKARFSLIPIHADPAAKYSIQSDDMAKWLDKTKLIEPNAAAATWYVEHREDVAEKRDDYLKKWDRMADSDKANLTLHARDGT